MLNLLETSAVVDPFPEMSDVRRQVFASPTDLFPELHPGIGNIPQIYRKHCLEHTKLVARQLRTKKVVLALNAIAGGKVFPVVKRCGVWNGSELSAASATLRIPPHLACPTALLHLKTKIKEYIYVCTRDARGGVH